MTVHKCTHRQRPQQAEADVQSEGGDAQRYGLGAQQHGRFPLGLTTTQVRSIQILDANLT